MKYGIYAIVGQYVVMLAESTKMATISKVTTNPDMSATLTQVGNEMTFELALGRARKLDDIDTYATYPTNQDEMDA